MEPQLPHLDPATRPKELARSAGLDADSIKLCTADDTCETFLRVLRTESSPAEAIRFVTATLDPLTAIEWAAACIKSVTPNEPWESDPEPVYEMVERWLDKPNEPLRRRAMAMAQETGYETAPEYLLGVIAYSGGSIAPEGMGDVPPPAGIYARMAAGAVISACYEDTDFQNRLAEALASLLEAAKAEPRPLVLADTDPALIKPETKPEPNIKSMLGSTGEATVKEEPKPAIQRNEGPGPKSLIPRRSGKL